MNQQIFILIIEFKSMRHYRIDLGMDGQYAWYLLVSSIVAEFSHSLNKELFTIYNLPGSTLRFRHTVKIKTLNA